MPPDDDLTLEKQIFVLGLDSHQLSEKPVFSQHIKQKLEQWAALAKLHTHHVPNYKLHMPSLANNLLLQRDDLAKRHVDPHVYAPIVRERYKIYVARDDKKIPPRHDAEYKQRYDEMMNRLNNIYKKQIKINNDIDMALSKISICGQHNGGSDYDPECDLHLSDLMLRLWARIGDWMHFKNVRALLFSQLAEAGPTCIQGFSVRLYTLLDPSSTKQPQ